jgi:hypothetical protein
MQTAPQNPYEELDKTRKVVNDYPSLQRSIQDAAEKLFGELLTAYPVADLKAHHQEITHPVNLKVEGIHGVAFAINPLNPHQVWRGFQVCMADQKTLLANQDAVLMSYSRRGPGGGPGPAGYPGNYTWTIWQPGTEAELAKKITGRSRLAYYPDGDSKTRWATNGGTAIMAKEKSPTIKEIRTADPGRLHRTLTNEEFHGVVLDHSIER